MYFRYAWMAPCSFVLNLLAYLLAPFLAALSMILRTSILPYPLNLFHTHDDDLDGGQHQLGWPQVSGIKLWWQRTHWIWRNPAYGFDAYWFGFPDSPDARVVSDVTKGSFPSKPESRFVEIEAGGKTYFSWRYKYPWNDSRHAYIWLGWTFRAYGTHWKLKVSGNPYRKN